MTTPHSHIEQNPQAPIMATSTMTDDKQHEVRCGMCARELYVDEESHRFYSDALLPDSTILFAVKSVAKSTTTWHTRANC